MYSNWFVLHYPPTPRQQSVNCDVIDTLHVVQIGKSLSINAFAKMHTKCMHTQCYADFVSVFCVWNWKIEAHDRQSSSVKCQKQYHNTTWSNANKAYNSHDDKKSTE